jgi:hypothetical protein
VTKDEKILEKRVYDKYPVSKRELECLREKKRMAGIRDAYRKRLFEITKEKKEY